jgi:hypothetical protein
VHGFARDLTARQVEHYAAVANADDTIGIGVSELDLMQNADDRDALGAGEPLQKPHDFLGRFRVETCDRLIRQQHLGPLRQRAGDCDPLRLTAGQRASPLVRQLGEAYFGEAKARSFKFRSRQATECRAQREMAAECS